MRRIVLIVALVVVLAVAGYMLLRPRKAPDKTTTSAESGTASKSSGTRGRTTGRIKAKTKEELKAEKKQRRKEEKRRKRELRRQQREQRRRLRAAKRGKRSRKRGGRRGQLYTVSAIISLGSESYALIDGRRVMVGDIVMGRRVVAILPDRLEIEAFGRMTTVRVGESLLPSYYYEKRRRG